ncbi:MAG: YjbQ family protein [Candidatus Aenigmatarchaeota archaeon]|mgnify:CR=1 FL=1|nr:MAG: YjbQ family protein [Candidatus Aenigmarchaeota archaeon]
MAVVTKSISVSSKSETDIIDITREVQEMVSESGLKAGVASVFVSGSTASVSTIEFEPNLVQDMKDALERLAPSGIKYKHTETWGDDNGKSHVRATLMGPSTTVPFKGGKLLLGTWQQIVVLDFDVPARKREVVVTLVGD